MFHKHVSCGTFFVKSVKFRQTKIGWGGGEKMTTLYASRIPTEQAYTTAAIWNFLTTEPFPYGVEKRSYTNAIGETKQHLLLSPTNFPNNSLWESGETTVKVKMGSISSPDIYLKVSVGRLDYTGYSTIEETLYSAEQQLSTSDTTYTFTIPNKVWSGGSSSDRMAVFYYIRNASGAEVTYEVEFGTEETSIITPVAFKKSAIATVPHIWDSFDRPDGPLTNAESGQPWVSDVSTYGILSNKMTVTSGTESGRIGMDLGISDFVMEFKAKQVDNSHPYLSIRSNHFSASLYNGYRVTLDSGGQSRIRRYLDSQLNVGYYNLYNTIGQTYKYRFVVIGDRISLFADGSRVLDIIDDSALKTNTIVKFITYGSGMINQLEIDDFVVNNPTLEASVGIGMAVTGGVPIPNDREGTVSIDSGVRQLCSGKKGSQSDFVIYESVGQTLSYTFLIVIEKFGTIAINHAIVQAIAGEKNASSPIVWNDYRLSTSVSGIPLKMSSFKVYEETNLVIESKKTAFLAIFLNGYINTLGHSEKSGYGEIYLEEAVKQSMKAYSGVAFVAKQVYRAEYTKGSHFFVVSRRRNKFTVRR